MNVTLVHRGHRITGLHIGEHNARQYFSPEWRIVELELGHLSILCSRPSQFQNNCPEIVDTRLGLWLECKLSCNKSQTHGRPLTLTPLGAGVFRLTVASAVAVQTLGLSSQPAATAP